MILLGLDPGGTTGWSLLSADDEGDVALRDSGQITGGLDGLVSWFVEGTDWHTATTIIYESWTQRNAAPRTSDQYLPIYCIGAIELHARAVGVPAIGRTPAQNKSAVTDEVIKRLDLWGQVGHDNRHQRDSTRVVLGYLKGLKGWPGRNAFLKRGWTR